MEDRTRSRRYPAVSLSQSIKNASAVLSKLGPGSHTRELISDALGSPKISGSSARKVAAMASFGLLTSSKNGYAVSGLARQIIKPLPGEEEELRRRALESVSLYKEIISEFQGEGRLPDALPILLERRFGILTGMGENVARTFVESATFAGVIDSDRRFKGSSEGIQPDLGMEDEEDQVQQPAAPPTRQQPSQSSGTLQVPEGQISVSLTNPSTIFFTQPSMTRRQKERVMDFIDRVVKPWLEFQVEEEEDEAM